MDPESTSSPGSELESMLETARSTGRVELDLTESDPSRCGLSRASPKISRPSCLREKRPARPRPVSPRRVRQWRATLPGMAHRWHRSTFFFPPLGPRPFDMPSRRPRTAARCFCLIPRRSTLCPPAPHSRSAVTVSPSMARGISIDAQFAERWQPGPGRSSSATRAPPTGAMLTRGELRFLESLCGDRGLALVADESFLDTALAESVSVSTARRCLALHVSGSRESAACTFSILPGSP